MPPKQPQITPEIPQTSLTFKLPDNTNRFAGIPTNYPQHATGNRIYALLTHYTWAEAIILQRKSSTLVPFLSHSEESFSPLTTQAQTFDRPKRFIVYDYFVHFIGQPQSMDRWCSFYEIKDRIQEGDIFIISNPHANPTTNPALMSVRQAGDVTEEVEKTVKKGSNTSTTPQDCYLTIKFRGYDVKVSKYLLTRMFESLPKLPSLSNKSKKSDNFTTPILTPLSTSISSEMELPAVDPPSTIPVSTLKKSNKKMQKDTTTNGIKTKIAHHDKKSTNTTKILDIDENSPNFALKYPQLTPKLQHDPSEEKSVPKPRGRPRKVPGEPPKPKKATKFDILSDLEPESDDDWKSTRKTSKKGVLTPKKAQKLAEKLAKIAASTSQRTHPRRVMVSPQDYTPELISTPKQSRTSNNNAKSHSIENIEKLSSFDQKTNETLSSLDYTTEEINLYQSKTAQKLLTKFVDHVQLGEWNLPVHYPGSYPHITLFLGTMYVCPWCLRYTSTIYGYQQHLELCLQRCPPGGPPVYRCKDISIYEVDGDEFTLYCQCLALLGRCFLDSKNVLFGTSSFLFYVMVKDLNYDISNEHNAHIVPSDEKCDDQMDENNPQYIPITFPYLDFPKPGNKKDGDPSLSQTEVDQQYELHEHIPERSLNLTQNTAIVGYFSKEKASSHDYNLSCIIVLPQYQRYGYGTLLIDFSYQLTKLQKSAGTPERPLSFSGRVTYSSYWMKILLRSLIEYVYDENDGRDELPLTHEKIGKTIEQSPKKHVNSKDIENFEVFDKKEKHSILKTKSRCRNTKISDGESEIENSLQKHPKNLQNIDFVEKLSKLTIKHLSERTGIHCDDVITTLDSIGLLCPKITEKPSVKPHKKKESDEISPSTADYQLKTVLSDPKNGNKGNRKNMTKLDSIQTSQNDPSPPQATQYVFSVSLNELKELCEYFIPSFYGTLLQHNHSTLTKHNKANHPIQHKHIHHAHHLPHSLTSTQHPRDMDNLLLIDKKCINWVPKLYILEDSPQVDEQNDDFMHDLSESTDLDFEESTKKRGRKLSKKVKNEGFVLKRFPRTCIAKSDEEEEEIPTTSSRRTIGAATRSHHLEESDMSNEEYVSHQRSSDDTASGDSPAEYTPRPTRRRR